MKKKQSAKSNKNSKLNLEGYINEMCNIINIYFANIKRALRDDVQLPDLFMNLEGYYSESYRETTQTSSMLSTYYLKNEYRRNQNILLLSLVDYYNLEEAFLK